MPSCGHSLLSVWTVNNALIVIRHIPTYTAHSRLAAPYLLLGALFAPRRFPGHSMTPTRSFVALLTAQLRLGGLAVLWPIGALNTRHVQDVCFPRNIPPVAGASPPHCGQNRPASATRSKNYIFKTNNFITLFGKKNVHVFGASLRPKLR